MEPSTLTWTHQETDASASLGHAIAAAHAGSWGALAPELGAGYLRSLLVASLYSAQAVGSRPASREGAGLHRVLGGLRAGDYGPEALLVASALARTLQLLLPPGRYSQGSITTRDGSAAVVAAGRAENVDTGALPVIVIVAGITAAAGASIVIASRAASVIDTQLARKAEMQRLLATQARALAMVEQHTKRSEAAGQPVPWTPEELELFHSLLQQQEALAARESRTMPTPFPGATKALEGVAAGASWLVPLAVVAGGFVLVQMSKGR